MKTFRHILLYLQAAIFLGLSAACSDDMPSQITDIDDYEIANGITLRIPNFSKGKARFTRGGDDATSKIANLADQEGTIANVGNTSDKDLWLFIYYAGTDNSKKSDPDYNIGLQLSKVSDISALPSVDKNGNPVYAGTVAGKQETDDDYYAYKIPLFPGTYKIYMVANLDKYTGRYSALTVNNSDKKGYVTSALPAATDIESDILNFKDKLGDNIIEPDCLPMACMPEDVSEGATFDILDERVENITCNLNFLCAKVRYTIFFDNTASGHSRPQFGANNFLDFSAANTVKDIIYESKVKGTTEAKYITTATPLPLEKVEWPSAGINYPGKSGDSSAGDAMANGINNNKITNLEPLDEEYEYKNTDTQRAWQGVIYLPENLTTKRTKLHFDGYVGDTPNPYDLELGTGIKDDAEITPFLIERGTFYDLTLLAKGRAAMDINFTVEDWDPVKIFYELHGPYYLRIEETKVNVEPGVVYSMWIDSNAPEVTGHSPMVTIQENGENVSVPLYIIEQDKDNKNLLTVRINPRVKSKYFADITANSTQYNFFHIEAGNIHKKIEIYPFELELFLRVPSDDPVIKVREEIGSGKYSGSYPVTIETNYDEFMITPVDWKKLFGSSTDVTTNTSTLIWLEDEKGNKVQFNTWIKASASGVMNYQLKYAGLNDGETFWTDLPQDMKLKIKGRTEDGASVSEEEKVNIKTYPSSDDYVIHVKVPSSWSWPHIYVYQCLEFPANTDDPDRANKAIATESSGTSAALEYSFTGKIAFRGWNVGDYNNPNAPTGKTSNGFYYFTGDDKDSWKLNPDNVVPDAKHYYQRDFCEAYRPTITGCDDCKDDRYNKLWPGIMMKYEKDGKGGKWYVFKLTGVATPGKALLMWSNGHKGSQDNGYRYPYGGNNPQPGIPLFNFDNREGWIDITSDNAKSAGFQPSNPDESEDEGDDPVYKYRIYFENGNNTISVWVDGSDSKLVDNAAGTVYEGYKNGGGGFDYKYVDFEHAGDRQTTIKYKLSTDSKDGTVGKYLEEFSKDGDRFSVHIWKGTTYPNHPG